jgi:hypothetical protein
LTGSQLLSKGLPWDRVFELVLIVWLVKIPQDFVGGTRSHGMRELYSLRMWPSHPGLFHFVADHGLALEPAPLMGFPHDPGFF